MHLKVGRVALGIMLTLYMPSQKGQTVDTKLLNILHFLFDTWLLCYIFLSTNKLR